MEIRKNALSHRLILLYDLKKGKRGTRKDRQTHRLPVRLRRNENKENLR